jgi:hypothetical protein
MFCQNCGKENKDESIFCSSCGSKIIEEQPIKEEDSINNVTEDSINLQNNAENKDSINQQDNSKNDYYNVNNNKPNTTAIKRKPIPLKVKVGIIVGCVVVALITTLYIVGSSLSSPQKVAEKYMQSQVDKDWEKTYDYLSIQESDFITKDLYLKMKSQDSDDDIVSYTIQKDDDDNNNDLEKYVNVSYKVKGSSNNEKKILNLVKEDDKFLFFFSKWKVASDDQIQKNYNIFVPNGTKAYLDGIEISDNYLNDDGNSDDRSYNSYKINEVFNGTHKIKVTSDIYNDFETDVTDKLGANVNLKDMELKDECKAETEKIAKEFLEKYYNSVISGKDFSDIKDYISNDTDVQDEMKVTYSNVQSDAIDKEKNLGVNKITFSNVTAKAAAGNGSTGKVKVNVKFNYQYSGKRQKFFSDEIEDFTSDDEKATNKDFYFDYVDGKWVITDMETIYLYF